MIEVGDILDLQITAGGSKDIKERVSVGLYAVIALTDNHIHRFTFQDFSKSSSGKPFFCKAFQVEDWVYAIVEVVGIKPDKYNWRLKVSAEILEIGTDYWKLSQETDQMQRERQRGIN